MPIGTLVVVEPVTPDAAETLGIGTVVTFQEQVAGPYITHRIIAINEGTSGIEIVTKGDANSTPDAPVSPAQVHARMVYSVPYLGMIAGTIPGEAKSTLAPAAGFLLLGASAIMLIAQMGSHHAHRRASSDEAANPRE